MPRLPDRRELRAPHVGRQPPHVRRRRVLVQLAVDELHRAADLAELRQILLRLHRQDLVDVERHLILLVARQLRQIPVVVQLHDPRQVAPHRVVQQLRGLQVLARRDVVARARHVVRHRVVQKRRERRDHRPPHARAPPRQREQRRHPAPRHRQQQARLEPLGQVQQNLHLVVLRQNVLARIVLARLARIRQVEAHRVHAFAQIANRLAERRGRRQRAVHEDDRLEGRIEHMTLDVDLQATRQRYDLFLDRHGVSPASARLMS
ncbi:Uncharacterised protein [Burkholderia pseudomallei]|nr:hypothetical protein X962_6433 [Burkholderia pseudomallei MSHR7343]KGS51173.1 hypothetical protein X961_6352 [Burkholderia pseudomallei MSHR5613]KGS96304.1 hypothetical protein X963_6214 [Burkholderia pseudomallei MSHR7498]KGV58937.1 hypothetical protein X898_4950 [Burkholderia pseudomallei ABCPW 91]CAJ3159601.1 Uncharacterised protein [Burkholderia pseudomallei]